jgi:hypothetical protein
MRCKHFKRALTVWACTSGIALLSGAAALAELPRHPVIRTLEATPAEIQPVPEEPGQALYFGSAVAIRDGTAFVGMPEAFGRGRVAIFTQTASGWQRTGTLTAPENVSDSRFGQSLAFRDGYVIVGARQAAYVFKRGNGRWNLSQRLLPPAGEIDFAHAMHYESGILVIGAPNTFSDRRHGTAYVYERSDASASLHSRRHVEQRDWGEGVPAAAAGALPEVRCARKTAIDTAIALGAAKNAREAQRQVGALLRRELRRIAGDGADDLAEARILAQQVRETIAHEWLLLETGDDRRVSELGARRRLGADPGVEAALDFLFVAATDCTQDPRQRECEQARM